jgi:predicted DNA-binding antitoxin AbrB/MazE fold protein
MKKYFLALFLFSFFAIPFSSQAGEVTSYLFSDVQAGNEYEKGIYELFERGLVNGYPGGIFKPEKNITRAEFTKIVIEGQMNPLQGNCTDDIVKEYKISCDFAKEFEEFKKSNHASKFSDVKKEAWYFYYVNFAASKGIIDGNNGVFFPERNINYAEGAKILVNTFIEKTDSATEGDWWTPFQEKLEEKYFLSFEGTHLLTRGEMVDFVYGLKFKENLIIHGIVPEFLKGSTVEVYFEEKKLASSFVLEDLSYTLELPKNFDTVISSSNTTNLYLIAKNSNQSVRGFLWTGKYDFKYLNNIPEHFLSEYTEALFRICEILEINEGFRNVLLKDLITKKLTSSSEFSFQGSAFNAIAQDISSSFLGMESLIEEEDLMTRLEKETEIKKDFLEDNDRYSFLRLDRTENSNTLALISFDTAGVNIENDFDVSLKKKIKTDGAFYDKATIVTVESSEDMRLRDLVVKAVNIDGLLNEEMQDSCYPDNGLLNDCSLQFLSNNKVELVLRGGESVHEVSIDRSSYDYYPAVFLKLSENKTITIDENFKERESIDADLWIEPKDPEISMLQEDFEGISHIGNNSQFFITDENFEDISRESIQNIENILFSHSERLPENQIKEGTVFIVKSSDDLLFKIKITHFDQGNSEMKLIYQQL